MESATQPMRMVLVLGKYRVSSVEQAKLTGDRVIKVELGGSTTMTMLLPNRADVRVGDLLTFYTEVLMKGQPDALIVSTPIQ